MIMEIHAMRSVRALTRLACGASLAVLAVAPAWAQDAAGESVASEDEIVVTGFRASLDKALDQKRDSIAAVDVIVAERSEARRVGTEFVSTCRLRWSPYHSQQKTTTPKHDVTTQDHNNTNN